MLRCRFYAIVPILWSVFLIGPSQLSRRLVSTDNTVYATLGFDAPLTAIDAATGKTLQTYEGTDGTEEIITTHGILFLVVRKGKAELADYAPLNGTVGDQALAREMFWNEDPRILMAVDAETGQTLWAKQTKISPLTNGKLFLSTIDGRLIELVIELRNVSVKSGAFVLPRISFQIESGEYAVLMGTTGRGKTTLLESICGLRRVAEGQILIHGRDVTRWSPADREIGYVPQDLALFPTLTVREHLEFAMRLRKISVTVIVKRTQELSEVLGIGHLLTRSITGLSGSMLKWIHVAVTLRALLLSVFALLKSYGPQRARS